MPHFPDASPIPYEGQLPPTLAHHRDVFEFGRKLDESPWKTQRIDTNALSVDTKLWERIAKDAHVLTPEILSTYIPEYKKFHLLTEGQRLIYSKNGIPVFPDKVIVGLVAPSATGKDTLLDHLLLKYPKDISKIKTTTDRGRRISQNEPGDGYNFINTESFDRRTTDNAFVESIVQGTSMYGTEIKEFLEGYAKDPQILVWRGDVAGAPEMTRFCKLLGIPFVCIGVLPGLTEKQMRDRVISKRGTGPKEQWRLRKAYYEIETLPRVADFILMNYPTLEDAGAQPIPVEAIDALGKTMRTMIGKEETLRTSTKLN